MDNEKYLTMASDTLIKLSRNTNNKKFKQIGKSDYFRAKNFERENRNQIKSYYNYKRGTIVFVDFGIGVGSEFSLPHFAIVLDNKDNPRKGVLTVVPLSSKPKKKYINLGKDLINKLMNSTLNYFHLMNDLILHINEIDSMIDYSRKEDQYFELPTEDFEDLMVDFKNRHDPYSEVIQLSLLQSWIKEEENWINNIVDKYSKFDKNTFANVENVTTISKLRILKPLNPADPIGRTVISEESLQKIEREILKNITTVRIDNKNEM